MTPSLLTDSVTYDLDRAVHYALLWGLEGLELRSIGGVHDRVPNVNEHKLKMRLMECDLPVTAVDPAVFVGSVHDRAAWLNEVAQLGETFDFCSRIGCSRVVVSCFRLDRADEYEDAGPAANTSDRGGAGSVQPTDAELDQAAEALTRAARAAERREMKLCVLNEEGGLAPTGSMLLHLLEAVDSDSVRVAWDPVAALLSGEHPAAGLEAVRDRVEAVRCRNAARVGNGYEPRPIDNGDVDWDDQIRQLTEVGFDGPVSLDVDVEPLAKQGLHQATVLIKLLRQQAGSKSHRTNDPDAGSASNR